MDTSKTQLLFWAQRWNAARQIYKFLPRQNRSTLYNMNQMLYLTEVFSWMLERRANLAK